MREFIPNEFRTLVLMISGIVCWCVIISLIISFLWTYISYLIDENEFPQLNFSTNCMKWLPLIISIASLIASIAAYCKH